MKHKKFGKLTADEQKELLYAAYVLGKEMQGLVTTFAHNEEWVRSFVDCWNPDLILRVRPTLPSINWEHVHEKYKWLAINCYGVGILFTVKPELGSKSWNTSFSTAEACDFASFQAGDCHWTESLIERPKAG